MGLKFAELMAQVRDNQARLSACPGPHEFIASLSPPQAFGGRWSCKSCGGHVDAIARAWYQQGMTHGSRLRAE